MYPAKGLISRTAGFCASPASGRRLPPESPKPGLSRAGSMSMKPQASQQQFASMTQSEVPTFDSPAEERRARRIWGCYLWGQLANVAKAAVWWSMFGTLVISLLGDDSAVFWTRAAFNLALVVLSPLAGAISEVGLYTVACVAD